MELSGKIKVLNETQIIGRNGFQKREVVITTEDQYPQHILVEFVQDKCDSLNGFEIGQDVKIDINLRGREWINPKGVSKYFNSIQGWRIVLLTKEESTAVNLPKEEPASFIEEDENDLPF